MKKKGHMPQLPESTEKRIEQARKLRNIPLQELIEVGLTIDLLAVILSKHFGMDSSITSGLEPSERDLDRIDEIIRQVEELKRVRDIQGENS